MVTSYRMRRRTFPALSRLLVILVATVTLGSCGMKAALKDIAKSVKDIAKSVKEVTQSATALLDNGNEFLEFVETQAQSGQISRELADLLDARVANLMNEVDQSLQSTGGILYDVVNGALETTFANISDLLEQIKQDILDGSVPSLIEQLSEQLMLETNLIGSYVEDIVVLTFGNTFVLVDRATNTLVTFVSVALLGIGLIIFAVVLLWKFKRLNARTIAALVVMGIFILFFLSVILIRPVRAVLVAGLNMAPSYEQYYPDPKVTGVAPQQFVFGKGKRICVFGNRLDDLADARVGLFQGDQEKLTFPRSALVAVTRHQIVLGNLDVNLGWRVPRHADFRASVIASSDASEIERFSEYSANVNELIYPGRLRSVNLVPVVTDRLRRLEGATPVERRPTLQPLTTIAGPASLRTLPSAIETPVEFRGDVHRTVESIFGNRAPAITNQINAYFLSKFKLPAGDYELRVYDGDTLVSSPQLLVFENPPVPPPKPDISALDANWSLPAAKSQPARLRVTIGFAYPEQIDRSFDVRITSDRPGIPAQNLRVEAADVAGAISSNRVTVTTGDFNIPDAGQYVFTVTADRSNVVDESNEGNNTLDKPLSAGQYVYDLYFEFNSFPTLDNELPERLEFAVRVAGQPNWNPQMLYVGSPQPPHMDSADRYRSVLQGADVLVIAVYTPYRRLFGVPFPMPMGSASWRTTVPTAPSPPQEINSQILLRNAEHSWQITGNLNLRRRIQ